MGRSIHTEDGQPQHDFFSRIWISSGGLWRMVADHRTDITAAVADGTFDTLKQPVEPLPISERASGGDASAEIRRAIGEQHAAYWSKDSNLYRRYAGADLIRIAERGVRPGAELISMMRGNARLPAPPSDHLDVRVQVHGNTAVTTWLDEGRDPGGRPVQNRFMVVFAWRDDRWQMVHMQSTAVRRP